MTIEEMQQELEAAGYRLRLQVRGSYIALPFNGDVEIGDVIIQSYNNDTDGLIGYAYAHLQEKRQHAALLEFVNEVAHTMLIGNDHLKAQSAIYFKSEAKRILGED